MNLTLKDLLEKEVRNIEGQEYSYFMKKKIIGGAGPGNTYVKNIWDTTGKPVNLVKYFEEPNNFHNLGGKSFHDHYFGTYEIVDIYPEMPRSVKGLRAWKDLTYRSSFERLMMFVIFYNGEEKEIPVGDHLDDNWVEV